MRPVKDAAPEMGHSKSSCHKEPPSNNYSEVDCVISADPKP